MTEPVRLSDSFLRAKANDMYGSDDVDVSDDALVEDVSDAGQWQGCWVAARVWVPREAVLKDDDAG
jgi:hypothetical protein